MAIFKSTISRLKQGLAKTRQVLLSDVRTFLPGRHIDEALIKEIETALLQADVGVATTTRLIDGLRKDTLEGKLSRGEDALAYIKRELKSLWGAAGVPPLALAPSPPTVILVTGINGAGKTTSIAKLAHLFRSQGKSVLLAACDTFRAGAVRQLEIWAERLGVEVIKGQQGGDPAAVAFDACQAATSRKIDILIIDTAGRLHTQDPLMRQLAKIRSVIAKQIPGAPHEALLVLDATSGSNALRQAEEFSKVVPITGIFLAKLDGTAKGGIVIAIKAATSIPVKFIGLGETPQDIEQFNPDDFIEAMFAA